MCGLGLDFEAALMAFCAAHPLLNMLTTAVLLCTIMTVRMIITISRGFGQPAFVNIFYDDLNASFFLLQWATLCLRCVCFCSFLVFDRHLARSMIDASRLSPEIFHGSE